MEKKKNKQCRGTISVSTNGELHMSKKLLKPPVSSLTINATNINVFISPPT